MNKIKEARLQKGIKQNDLAQILKVSQGTLSNWERGEHDPDSQSLLLLSEILEKSIDYLLGGSDNASNNAQKNSSAGAEDEITFDDFTYAMHNESKDLTDDEKEMLLDMARMFQAKRKERRKDGQTD